MKTVFKMSVFWLGTLLLMTGAWAAEGWQSITDPVKVFEEGYIQVIGVSEEGQSRFKATRAATVVAQRELLEIMEGLRLYGETTVKDGMLQSDTIRTSVEGIVRGAMKCGEKYHDSRGYAEVCMRVHIRGKGGMYDVILPLIQEKKLMPKESSYYKPKLIPKAMTEETATPEPAKPAPAEEIRKVVKEAPQEAKPEVTEPSKLTVVYDGLIVDVRDYQFKPALVNTILTDKEEVVFDPSKILSEILVERGCGGFTTDPNKAKALLESWGSRKPMTVKGIGVIKTTNAKVSTDDAAAIYVHDKKSNLLANAKVVFLLK